MPPPESGLVPIYPVTPKNKHLWLFNIREDPYEKFDISDSHPSVVNKMLNRMQEYYKGLVPPLWPDPDVRCDPQKHGGVWGPWE